MQWGHCVPIALPTEQLLERNTMTNSNSKGNPPASSRERKSLDDDTKGGTQRHDPGKTAAEAMGRSGTAGTGDPNAKELPGGVDPRQPQFPGRMSTSENVTTDEQRAAQDARKKEDITGADVGPYATASRAEQIESQVAAAENPLAPQSTSSSEPHAGMGGGLDNPPAPEGYRSLIPRGRPASWKFDPETGDRLAPRQRTRLEEDDDEEVEVNIVGPVTLTRDDGSTTVIQPGKQKMRRSDADHWYVKAHTANTAQERKESAQEQQPRKAAGGTKK
jgi:hypothetical protein